MTTSQTYTFGSNTQIDAFFREAFERIGIMGNKLTNPMVISAMMSANLALTEWLGKGPNSWMRKQQIIGLIPGQAVYSLSPLISQIVDVIAIQPQSILNKGTVISSGVISGNPVNVFNALPNTGCTLAPNGSIGYNLGTNNAQSLFYLGIQPLLTGTYSYSLQYSLDGMEFVTLFTATQTRLNAPLVEWSVISAPPNAQIWQVVNTGDNDFPIQQLSFSQPATTLAGDRALLPISYTEWMQVSTKLNQGYPSSYFFNAQVSPTLTLWPIPATNSQYTALLMTAYLYAQDVVQLFQEFDLPQRFYEAICADLAYRLACKFKGDNEAQIARLNADRQEKFTLATTTDAANFSLRFTPDLFSQGYR